MIRRLLLALALVLGLGLPAEAAISLVNATKAAGSGTAISVTAPASGAIGDLALCVVNHNNETESIADNNGAFAFTEQGEFPGSLGSGEFVVYYRVLTGIETSPWQFTLSLSERWVVVCWILKNAGSGPFDVAPATVNNETGSNAPTSTGITTLSDKAWVFAVAATDGTGNGTFTGGPAGWTELLTENTQQPTSIFYKEFASPGATSNQDFAVTVSGNNYSLSQFSIVARDWGYLLTEASGCINAENNDRLITEDVTAGVGPCTGGVVTPRRTLLGVGP